MTAEVKTTLGNVAKISIDMARYKGKTKDAFIAAERPFWRKGQPGVPEAKLDEVLSDFWDKTYGKEPKKSEEPKEK